MSDPERTNQSLIEHYKILAGEILMWISRGNGRLHRFSFGSSALSDFFNDLALSRRRVDQKNMDRTKKLLWRKRFMQIFALSNFD